MHQGNTDRIGRAAWNGMIDELQKAVTDFINEKNRLYIENKEYRNQKIEEYQAKVDQLENRGQLPGISQQQPDEQDHLIDIYKNDISNLRKDESRAASEKFRAEAQNFHLNTLTDIIMTKTFNNSYDITYGYLSTNVTKEEWSDLFSSVHSVEKPHAECIRLTGTAVRSAHETELLKLANMALNAKDTLHTISSVMERSEWGECCLRNPDSCNMPNMKRTPDIAVCVICQSHEDSVSCPIFIGEILRKKNQAHEMKRYEGYNAALQILVFARRGYYWEIPITDAKMYKLERNPTRGEIRTSSKTYKIAQCAGDGKPDGIMEMLKDICHVLFEGLINLRPIADHSACALYAANYREFLLCLLEAGRKNPIQTHCWHICTPRASSWNDDNPPKPFHPNDAEDLEKTPKEKKTIQDSRFRIDEEGCVIPVTEEAYDYSKLNDAFIEYITPI